MKTNTHFYFLKILLAGWVMLFAAVLHASTLTCSESFINKGISTSMKMPDVSMAVSMVDFQKRQERNLEPVGGGDLSLLEKIKTKSLDSTSFTMLEKVLGEPEVESFIYDFGPVSHRIILKKTYRLENYSVVSFEAEHREGQPSGEIGLLNEDGSEEFVDAQELWSQRYEVKSSKIKAAQKFSIEKLKTELQPGINFYHDITSRRDWSKSARKKFAANILDNAPNSMTVQVRSHEDDVVGHVQIARASFGLRKTKVTHKETGEVLKSTKTVGSFGKTVNQEFRSDPVLNYFSDPMNAVADKEHPLNPLSHQGSDNSFYGLGRYEFTVPVDRLMLENRGVLSSREFVDNPDFVSSAINVEGHSVESHWYSGTVYEIAKYGIKKGESRKDVLSLVILMITGSMIDKADGSDLGEALVVTYSDLSRMYTRYGLHPVKDLSVDIDGEQWSVLYGHGDAFLKKYGRYASARRLKKMVGQDANKRSAIDSIFNIKTSPDP